MSITRRQGIVGTVAALGAASLPGGVRAQTSELVVGTWGGAYGALLQSEIDEPIMKPQGIVVTQDIQNNDPRRTRLIAEKNEPKSGIDVACINDIDGFVLTEQDVLETIAGNDVPRVSEVLPVLRKPTTIPHLYSVLVVLYNPGKVGTAPKGYGDLFNPDYAGRVGFSDNLYNLNIAAANIGVGGAMHDFEPGLKALRDLKEAGPKTFPTNEALGAALKAEEVWVSLMTLARGFMWKQSGFPVAWAIPEEGGIPIMYEAGVPRNARNKAAAWKYLDAMLDPKVQLAFSEKMGYGPTVKDARLPEELAREISLGEADLARLRPLDYTYMQKVRGTLLDFWNKEFKG